MEPPTGQGPKASEVFAGFFSAGDAIAPFPKGWRNGLQSAPRYFLVWPIHFDTGQKAEKNSARSPQSGGTMRRHCQGKGTAVLLAALLATTFSFAADSQEKKGKLVSLENLKAFAFTNKREYVLGEPVFLRIVLANWSFGDKFELTGYWHPANDLEIKVARAGEMPERFTAGVENVLIPALTYILRPRTMRTHRIPLCFEPKNQSGFLFDKPGTYRISCKMRLLINSNERVLTFPELRIAIRQPTPEQRRVLDLLMNPECASDLQTGRVGDKTFDAWEAVADQYPKSLWAPYAKLLLAQRDLDKPRQDYRALEARLEQMLRDYPDFPLRDDIYYGIAACQDRLGHPLEVLDWLYRMQREFPASHHIRSGSPLFKKYIYRKGWEDTYAPWYLRE